MSRPYVVLRCSARHDGQYLITFRKPSGLAVAVSINPLEVGAGFTLRDGPDGYDVAIPKRGVHA